MGSGLLDQDSLGPDASLGSGDGLGDVGAASVVPVVVYPNLGSQLSELAVAASSGAGVDSALSGTGTVGGDNATSGAPLLLSMQLDGNRDGVLEFLADNGVVPANVVGDYLEVDVPPSLLGPLAGQSGVARVREMPEPFRARGSVTSRGVGAHGAAGWHGGGFTGEGVKVGVIDVPSGRTNRDGFTGLRALSGTELPSKVVGRCYVDVGRPTSDLANCDSAGGDNHGTEVAEAIMDVAPEEVSGALCKAGSWSC